MEFHKIFVKVRSDKYDIYKDDLEFYENLPFYKRIFKVKPEPPISDCYIEYDRLYSDEWRIKDDRYMTILSTLTCYMYENYGDGKEDLGNLITKNIRYRIENTNKHLKWYRVVVDNFFGEDFDIIMQKLIKEHNGRLRM